MGWGRVHRSSSTVEEPEDTGGLRIGDSPTIVHAGGRSYGDTALNAGGTAILTARLNRVLAFDQATGAITVEPGVTFRQLLHDFLPRGWLVPVTPGTGFATIGGAVALDVHGKNHETAGSFGQHVTALGLLTPDGAVRTIGPAHEQSLFRATIGGIGLTGVLTQISFTMKRVPGPAVRVHEQRMPDLPAFLYGMEQAAGATYSVGWIDGTARGAKLGRGILEVAEPVADRLTLRDKAVRVPFDFPAFALNPLTVSAFNCLYYRRVPKTGRTRLARTETFLYPLDALHDWNRIYGRRGFHQFQCVVPFEAGEQALRTLLEIIAERRQASFLAVLKRMGSGRAGMLSFPRPGYTLALDFPAKTGVEDLYTRLVKVTRDFGGRVYLAKDALIGPEDVAAMYPELQDFRAVLDPPKSTRRKECARTWPAASDYSAAFDFSGSTDLSGASEPSASRTPRQSRHARSRGTGRSA